MNLLILDINGVLVDRNRKNFTKKEGLDIFLDYVFEHFTVAVWTSAKHKNAKKIIRQIFTPEQKLLFEWNQSHCKIAKNPDKKYPLFLKNLEDVWKAFPGYNKDNTIIVDDNPLKLRNNPEYTTLISTDLCETLKCLKKRKTKMTFKIYVAGHFEVMPSADTLVEGRGNSIKTILRNITEISNFFEREPEKITKVLGIRLGARSKFELDISTFNGAFTSKNIEETLIKLVLNTDIDHFLNTN